MDGGRRGGNSTAIDGLMAGTAMDDATVTQRQWTVDGNGRHVGVGWTAMDGLMAMDADGRLINGDGRWMAMDGNGRRDSHSSNGDGLTAMDSEGLLNGDSTRMDDEERHEWDSDGPRAQR